MKKLLSAIITISMLVVILTGCGGEKSPTDVAKEKIESYKTNVESILNGEENSDAMSLGEDVEKKIADLIMEFEYTVENEVIDGDKATVDVTIKTCEIGDMFKTAMGNYISQAFGLALSGASEEELEEKAKEAFTTAIEEMDSKKTFEKTFTVNLTHGDDGWKVEELDDNEDFLNAVTGGLLEVVSDMGSWFLDME